MPNFLVRLMRHVRCNTMDVQKGEITSALLRSGSIDVDYNSGSGGLKETNARHWREEGVQADDDDGGHAHGENSHGGIRDERPGRR